MTAAKRKRKTKISVINKPPSANQAEYFALCQVVMEPKSLSERGNQFDCEPVQTESWKARWHELYKSIDPGWKTTDGVPRQIQSRTSALMSADHRLPSNMMPRQSCFKRPTPANLAHIERLETIYGYQSHLSGYWGGADVVSREWRDAVEDACPGVHDFYPHDLVFSDKTHKYYVFITRSECRPTNFAMSHVPNNRPPVAPLGRADWFFSEMPKWITIEKSKLNPVAYQIATDWSTYYAVVAKPLAELLRPLLPRYLKLMPLHCSP